MPRGDYVGWIIGLVGLATGELRARTSARQLSRLATVLLRRGARRDPTRALGCELTSAQIESLIGALPSRERLFFNLYWFDELSIEEIAPIFGITALRAGVIHSNVLLKLRAITHLAPLAA